MTEMHNDLTNACMVKIITVNNVTRTKRDTKHISNPLFNEMLLSLSDVALFDEEVVDFPGLVDVDLDERPGLGQPQPALPPALVQ